MNALLKLLDFIMLIVYPDTSKVKTQ